MERRGLQEIEAIKKIKEVKTETSTPGTKKHSSKTIINTGKTDFNDSFNLSLIRWDIFLNIIYLPSLFRYDNYIK